MDAVLCGSGLFWVSTSQQFELLGSDVVEAQCHAQLDALRLNVKFTECHPASGVGSIQAYLVQVLVVLVVELRSTDAVGLAIVRYTAVGNVVLGEVATQRVRTHERAERLSGVGVGACCVELLFYFGE